MEQDEGGAQLTKRQLAYATTATSTAGTNITTGTITATLITTTATTTAIAAATKDVKVVIIGRVEEEFELNQKTLYTRTLSKGCINNIKATDLSIKFKLKAVIMG